ncbi:amidohydrolase family protein [Vineibacter terrae]|uniref:amidohydrolase family protein n=1 Tax=Vineibacter terrae TaxID=2586908 RepID=UPI002E37E9F2|nr:amidohydrolase family protein [Vineibacter terrae]HEX2887802.1 amidohydrolase family protein [Vineibacter terrae]
MVHLLSEAALQRLRPAQERAFRSPIPTQMISNGEFTPLPQSPQQRRVEARIKELAALYGKKLGMSRRGFLTTASGMAAAFMAMNDVFGPVFSVSKAEAAEPDVAKARAEALASQFIFDIQTHFVHDGFKQEDLLGLAKYAADNWNRELKQKQLTLAYYKFENYVRQIFLNSDTKIALLSGAPFDDPSWWLIPNDQIVDTVEAVNRMAGARRMLGHFVFTPGQPGWMEAVDKALDNPRHQAWKGYTIGDPLTNTTRYPWRLDDEKLMYPFYEKVVKSGIRQIALHKGLMPADYETSWAKVWQYNTHWDIAKAAKDWPQINFVFYHGCLQPFQETPDRALAEFEKTGEIKWSSHLARIPEEHGVSNVYAELGTTFANSATANPRFAAALLGTFIKGMGVDHVIWGTDSVWYGSPQWQIEALRRLEIPEDMQKKHGFKPLGEADGFVKSTIFGHNSARLFGMNVRAEADTLSRDRMTQLKRDYAAVEGVRNNATYGFVAAG